MGTSGTAASTLSLIGGTVGSGGAQGANAFPWNQYFVTSFDLAKVAALDATAAFIQQAISVTIDIAGKPTPVNVSPLTEAKLDYALSTGLTGKGQTVGMIDNAVNLGHEQFAGKTITTDGYATAGDPAPAGGDFHGTGVASIMVADGIVGASGQSTVGFAPGANLFAGYLDYNQPTNFGQLASFMNDAAHLKVVAMNNSWGLANDTVASGDLPSALNSGPGASYLSALRIYAQGGIVVFAAQNDYAATSISSLAGLPSFYPDLQPSWLAVINAIPTLDSGGNITSAQRVSTGCDEAATYCLAADGQMFVAGNTGSSSYDAGTGASFAAPQVTGALALLAEAFPSMTAQQLRDRLLATANDSFYTATGTVTFAPGITHGYNAEFGMGFLDLKAALLPIGTTSVPTAAGGQIAQGSAAIVSGFASGSAIAQALGKARIVALDQMGGNFTTPGNTIAGTAKAPDLSGLRLAYLGAALDPVRMQAFSAAVSTGNVMAIVDHPDAFTAPDAATLLGLGEERVYDRNGLKLTVLRENGGLAGASAERTFDLGDGTALKLGLASFAHAGSILGISVPGTGSALRSNTDAVTVGYATRVSRDVTLRASGEFGTATGNGAGMVASFSPVSYNSLGVSLDTANAVQSGDVFSLFARLPVAVTGGQANMTLPTAFAAGQTSFSTVGVGLRPTARQIDMGFEYDQPLTDHASMAYGAAYSVNAGNITGATSAAAMIGVRFVF